MVQKNLAHILAFTPPLFVALAQKVSCETFQNYQISMYNSNTNSLGLILGVEVFFSEGHCSGALWNLFNVNLIKPSPDWEDSLLITKFTDQPIDKF